MMEERYSVMDYARLCSNLERIGVCIDLMIVLFDDPYLSTRVYTAAGEIDPALYDKRVEFNIYSFNGKNNSCNLVLFANMNEETYEYERFY